MKKAESSWPSRDTRVFGNDCCAANTILALHKLRYKAGKGDPAGFVAFLRSNGLPLSLFPRYRGNRLHVLFHIAGLLVHHQPLMLQFLKEGISCVGLRPAICASLMNENIMAEFVVLGLLGKLLTGPWMHHFYTPASSNPHHLDAVNIVQEITTKLKAATPASILQQQVDFFGHSLEGDEVFQSLRKYPVNNQFGPLLSACIDQIIVVIGRQYQSYFTMDITPELRQKTSSAPSHNMASERVMGMFSAAQQKAPAATMDHISCKIRAQKNATIEFLEAMDDQVMTRVVTSAIPLGRTTRQRRLRCHEEVQAQISARLKEKNQARVNADCKKLEKQLKSTTSIKAVLLSIGAEDKEPTVMQLLTGLSVGTKFLHIWFEDGKNITYNGQIMKMKKATKTKPLTYTIAYWKEAMDDALDYPMPALSLAVDFIKNDLFFF